MGINEQEYEEKMAQIVDQMEYLMMDIILMSLKKINTENLLLNELKEIRLEEQHQEEL